MRVKGKIKNKQYENLIKYAFQKNDALMFIFRKDGFSAKEIQQLDNTYKELKEELNQSFIKERNGSYWVFTKVGNFQLGLSEYKDSPNFQNLFIILFYKTTLKLENYLLSNALC